MKREYLRTVNDVVMFLHRHGVRDAIVYEQTLKEKHWLTRRITWPKLVICVHKADLPLARKIQTIAQLPIGVEAIVKKLSFWQRPYKIEVRYL